MADFDIVVVGELNADLILRGNVIPEFGQVEKLVEDATLTVGSSSAIFACGAARLGLRVLFIGKVGEDEFGSFMIRQLIERGVDVGGIIVDPNVKTGLTVILSRGSDRAILTYLGGSIGTLRLAEIDRRMLASARHLHMGSYFMQGDLCAETPTLFAKAHELGMTTSLDTNYDPTEQWDGGVFEVLRRTDVFLPNEVELAKLGGSEDVSVALETLISYGPLVAAKLGALGAAVRYQNHMAQAEALRIKVVDTTGAGDTFDAGFLYGWLNDWGLERSLRLGCVCGSLSTRMAGGVNGQPTLEEALERM